MLSIAICDDNRVDLKKIAALTQEWSAGRQMQEICIRNFLSPYDLINVVSRGEAIDIFLLDILMPDMTGIALGQRLRSILADPVLIYLTNSEDYYPDAFRLYAFQYLCKPISKRNLFPVLDRVSSRFARRTQAFFTLKTSEGTQHLPLYQIVYAELLSHVCHFHLADGRCLQSLYLRTGVEQFMAPLLADRRFIRTHAAFVINLSFAGRLTTNTLCLINGTEVPLSRAFAREVQKRYMAFGLGKEDDE